MYLSRLTLNPRNRRVQKELANPYELHRTLMSAFPEELPAGERILFRVDVDDATGIPTVLLQSHTAPDWAWLGDPRANGYLLRAPESKPFELTFTPGQTLTFRLRANPTEKRWLPKAKDDPTGEKKPMRVGLCATEEQSAEERQRAWLERKGVDGGFRALSVAIITEGKVYGRTSGETRHALQFDAVRFEGVLQVIDPDKLWATVQQGVGPGKGLGFGLLSLARA
jgi:CRISPR system Cascade subunit CasE